MSQPSSFGSASLGFPPDRTEAGAIFDGRYRIEQVIGEGGMGVVAKATDLRLDRTVAIKVLHPEFASQEDVLERFAREALVIAKLRSRHVVSVLDVSVDLKNPYLVLEYLEGESLEDRIFRDGPLPLAEAVRYTLQIAEALEEAHSVGILHRDIKPANVFLARQPNREIVAKVLDFGTARFYDAKRDGQVSKPTLTKQYETFGSPAYMPPEQISSARNTDERSDVWALGTVLYEAVTGKMAFEGEYPEVFVVISTREPPPLRSLRPDAPDELQTVVERCLRKVKEERYGSMTELKRALQSLESEILPSRSRPQHTVPSPPLSSALERVAPEPGLQEAADDELAGLPTPKRSLGWLVLLTAAVLVALAGIWFVARSGKEPSATAAPRPSVNVPAEAPPPEPVQATPAPSWEPVAEPAPSGSASRPLPVNPKSQKPAAPTAEEPTKPAIPGPTVAPDPTPQPSARKPDPRLPGEAPIPSGDDIGRRK